MAAVGKAKLIFLLRTGLGYIAHLFQRNNFPRLCHQSPLRGLQASQFGWRLSRGLRLSLGWLLEKQYNPNQANITRVGSHGGQEVVLKRGRGGHYVASGMINGNPVVFLVDTGATYVSVPLAVANRIGLKKGPAGLANTANGTVTVFSTRLGTVSLGHIELENVVASINPGMGGEEILLGMSFLGYLEMLQRGDELRLRIPGSDN